MAKLIYSAITSLDGYINDAGGRFDWARPDDDLHAYVNERERPIGPYLYRRRIYERMAVWGTRTSSRASRRWPPRRSAPHTASPAASCTWATASPRRWAA
jgi:hypothetical protein